MLVGGANLVNQFLEYYLIDGFMIGRAALMNPFIFDDIKRKVKYVSGDYEPVRKDPYVLRTDEVRLSEKKKTAILEFMKLANKHNLNLQLFLNNLEYLFKGLSKHRQLMTSLRSKTGIEDMILEFDKWN